MTKLSFFCVLMLGCSSVYANILDCDSASSITNTSTIELNINNNGEVGPMSTLPIPLGQLFPSKPYKITCHISNSNYKTDAVDIGPSFSSAKPIVVTYKLNGKSFLNSEALTKSDNKLTVIGVENVPTNLLCGRSSLNIGNEDQTNSITVTSCEAKPILDSNDN